MGIIYSWENTAAKNIFLKCFGLSKWAGLFQSSENAFKRGECHFKYRISVSGYKAVTYGKMLII